MVIQRGDIWWAELQEPAGSGPGHKRPLVIIQSDDFNKSRINTVIAVVLTTNLKLSDSPGNIFLSNKMTKLPKDCVANVSQVITIDRYFLSDRVGRMPAGTMKRIDDGLRLVLSL
jgi:mRNA interferase MazF